MTLPPRPGTSRFTARGGVGYALATVMVPRRAPTLCLWLAALLVAALGLLVPTMASAHAGHDAHAGHAGHWTAAAPEPSAALPVLDGFQAPPQGAPLTAAAPGEAASLPCGGAGCCNTGHGCCAALPVAAPAAPAMPLASLPERARAGLPPGLAAAALPEPPRPFR